MSADETRKRYERAREQGRQAFRGGRKVDACPYKGPSLRDLAEPWLTGWIEAKAERGRPR